MGRDQMAAGSGKVLKADGSVLDLSAIWEGLGGAAEILSFAHNVTATAGAITLPAGIEKPYLLWLVVDGANKSYTGGETLTSSNGFPREIGDGWPVYVNPKNPPDIYTICATGLTTTIRGEVHGLAV